MRSAWTRRLETIPVAMHLAREAGLIFVRDAEHSLATWDLNGEPLAHRRPAGSLAVSSCSEDGRTVACASPRGDLVVLREELSPGWERKIGKRPTALAVAPLGQAVAVADESGAVTVFDHAGQQKWQATAARPLMYLAWIAETGALVGSADFGLVCLFDEASKCVWRDGLVVHVGGLAASGDGKRIVLARFTEGLKLYSAEQQRPAVLGTGAAARAVALNYAGDVLLTLSVDATTLARHDGEGKVVEELALPGPVAGLALDALGESAIIALAAGELRRYDREAEAR